MSVPDIVTFGIPLMGRSVAQDWDRVVHQLNATIGSIYNQTDPNFRIVLACTDVPELSVRTDERFEVIQVEQIPPASHAMLNSDAARKRNRIGQRLRMLGGGYLMLTDADDLISNRLVEFVRAHSDPNGYVVTAGYVFDSAGGTLRPLPAPGENERFDERCGTCSILLYSPDDLPGTDSDYHCYFALISKYGHQGVRSHARSVGRPLVDLPFRAAVYVLNTGQNISRLSTFAAIADRFKSSSAGRLEEFAGFDLDRDGLAREFNLVAAERETSLVSSQRKPDGHFDICVLIPTYRRPAGLRRLLAALRPQIEGRSGRSVIVVNDGSHDDRYAAIADEFSDIVTYKVADRNRGTIATRNACVAESKAAYSVFVDDDCEPPDWWLDWLAARLRLHPEVDVVVGDTVPLWETRSFSERVQGMWFLPRPTRLDGRSVFVTANVAIRTDLIRAVGGFGDDVFALAGEDTELSIRLHRIGARFLVDRHWWVAHEVNATLRSIRRKYRRYGLENARLVSAGLLKRPLPSGILSEDVDRYSGIWPIVRYCWHQSREFEGNRVVQIAAGIAAASIRIAYLHGLLGVGVPPKTKPS